MSTSANVMFYAPVKIAKFYAHVWGLEKLKVVNASAEGTSENFGTIYMRTVHVNVIILKFQGEHLSPPSAVLAPMGMTALMYEYVYLNKISHG